MIHGPSGHARGLADREPGWGRFNTQDRRTDWGGRDARGPTPAGEGQLCGADRLAGADHEEGVVAVIATFIVLGLRLDGVLRRPVGGFPPPRTTRPGIGRNPRFRFE